MKKNKYKVLVIGDSCQDIFIYGKCSRLSPEAPVPVFNPLKTIKMGGMSLNVYENLKSLGLNVQIVTNKNKVTKTRIIDEESNQHIVRIDSNEKNDRIKNLSELPLSDYDAIIISDYNKGFLHYEDIKYICRNNDNVFVDTKKIIDDNFKDCKFIKINKKEYDYNLEHSSFLENFSEKLIITLGSDGAKFLGKHFPVKKVNIRDVAGAGDTFISALTFHFIKTKDIEESIKFANKCSNIIVQKKGVNKIGDFLENELI